MRTAAAMVAMVAWSSGCGGGPPGRGAPSTPAPALAVAVPASLPVAELRFTVDGAVPFALDAAGDFKIGPNTLGRLGADGRFAFAGPLAAVTAVLTDAGRIEIAAADGTELAGLPGSVGVLLRALGGTVRSGYVLQADGTATLRGQRTLAFDADGRLVDRDLVVAGLTPETRRTAMFLYVLLTTISP